MGNLPWLITVASILLLTGCAKRDNPTFSAPSAALTGYQVAKATVSVAHAKANVTTAKGSVSAAQQVASGIFRAAPVDLRPEVERLQRHLEEAQSELGQAYRRTEDATKDLEQAERHNNDLQKAVEEQTEHLNRTTEEKNKALVKLSDMEAQRNRFRAESWKWRLSFLGLLMALVLFIVRKPLGRLAGIPIP